MQKAAGHASIKTTMGYVQRGRRVWSQAVLRHKRDGGDAVARGDFLVVGDLLENMEPLMAG